MLHWVETGWSKLRASSMVTHWIIYDSHRGEVTYWINFTMCKVGKTKTAVDTLDLKVQRFTLGRKIVKTKWPTYSNWPCSMYVHGSHSPVPYDALFSAHLGLRKCLLDSLLGAWFSFNTRAVCILAAASARVTDKLKKTRIIYWAVIYQRVLFYIFLLVNIIIIAHLL